MLVKNTDDWIRTGAPWCVMRLLYQPCQSLCKRFLKMGQTRPLFVYFRLFNTVGCRYLKFDDDWCWKRPLYQLSHNHCQYYTIFLHCELATMLPCRIKVSKKKISSSRLKWLRFELINWSKNNYYEIIF